MEDRRLAVLFPGIGYHCDKPLMYYSAKLAKAAGYEVLSVPYTGFPDKVRGDADKMRESFEIAYSQAKAMLAQVQWADCRDILFIGKSIGTIVAGRVAMEKGVSARSVLLTPLIETFQFVHGDAMAFHGTADPWAETDAIIAACREKGIPLHLTEGADHSLETGDVLRDVRTIEKTMSRIEAFIGETTDCMGMWRPKSMKGRPFPAGVTASRSGAMSAEISPCCKKLSSLAYRR